MNRYRIYTENVGNIAAEVAKFFPRGATITPVLGIWEGEGERSVIIEVLSEKNAALTVEAFCEHVRKVNEQDAVLFTVDRDVDATFIT